MTLLKREPKMAVQSLPSLLASIAAASFLLGCQTSAQRADQQAPFGSMAQITAISPDTTQVLRAGQPVKLKLDVSYVLTAASATLTLVVLAADNSGIAQDFKVLSRGSGQSTLEAEFTVPNTSTIRVFTPLVVKGQTSTSQADGRAFNVISD